MHYSLGGGGGIGYFVPWTKYFFMCELYCSKLSYFFTIRVSEILQNQRKWPLQAYLLELQSYIDLEIGQSKFDV